MIHCKDTEISSLFETVIILERFQMLVDFIGLVPILYEVENRGIITYQGCDDVHTVVTVDSFLEHGSETFPVGAAYHIFVERLLAPEVAEVVIAYDRRHPSSGRNPHDFGIMGTV